MILVVKAYRIRYLEDFSPRSRAANTSTLYLSNDDISKLVVRNNTALPTSTSGEWMSSAGVIHKKPGLDPRLFGWVGTFDFWPFLTGKVVTAIINTKFEQGTFGG